MCYNNSDKEEVTHTAATKIIIYGATSFTAGYDAAFSAILRDIEQTRSLVFRDLRNIQDLAFLICHPFTGNEMERRELVSDFLKNADWILSTSNELGQMAQ